MQNSSVAPSTATAQQLATASSSTRATWSSPSPLMSLSSSMTSGKPNGGTGPSSPADFPKYSASTEEILKRVVGANAARAGTPGYEAARESILKNMVTSDRLGTPAQPVLSSRGRGGGRGGRPTAGSPLANGESINGTSTSAAGMTPTGTKGRGRGRGRGSRGGGRGGKRKREDNSDEDDAVDDDSDTSENYTPQITQTKSGRQVSKPTQFVPVLPSPSSGTKRKRTHIKKPELIVCKICSRATSQSGNFIVYCDGCNSPYHQYCHDPPIGKDVVKIQDKEWLCSECSKARLSSQATSAVAGSGLTLNSLVAAPELNPDEKRQYFSSLPSSTLVDLLCHSASLHPNLPVFTSNARMKLNDINHATNGTTSLAPSSLLKPPQSNSNAQSTSSLSSPPASTDSLPSALTTAALNSGSAPTSVPLTDAYDEDYDTGHFPKPGNGLARTLRPESEDFKWLVDDNFEVFSHNDTYGEPDGVNGFD
ncbi:hypothetical protein EJ05DRAFT_497639 [Pseudovirgaria hyperparasitica]|uniref:PHD-type domain-containing protein n=1 Tax=Pseudovirgaria hyperparasitica TaxID=470096 RepID=A0A6A6WG82_9PEZI|nr:uncharacterized protein EJ05DRAFT_497639 [Pseudovirgaria hyperparasitica]KAF2761074.1 hypothetical protein EJ05DRAFT_497639 [Pseudovirgaria hyperparasitica]